MPYRHAWLFIAALIGVTVVAFWRTYFGMLGTASAGFHAHGVTASLWMLLLLAQSISPHVGRLALHRALGRTTFVAVPLFAAGAVAVLHSMSSATTGGSPFYALWGARLAFLDLLAFGAVLYGAGLALRHRRAVRLHAGYMLSTALPLVSPALGRLINQTVPGLTIRGPQDFGVFGTGVQLANLIAGLVALWLWRRDPRHGRPWAVALGVIVVQIAGFEIVGRIPEWRSFFLGIGLAPLPALMTLGLAIGAAVVVAGWMTSPQPARRVPAS